MTEPFVGTETDRTKSRWFAKTYHDFVAQFCRSRTTLRALFYYALQRKVSDYPICGGFVGEIRIIRPYHESDGEKLPKWMGKARTLGFIPADAILDEIPGEHFFLPERSQKRPYSIEVWLNKSALNPLLYPICEKHGATLVSVSGSASADAIKAFYQRGTGPTIILCLSDLSSESAFFCRDLAARIAESMPQGSLADTRVKCIGLKPDQVQELKIPMVRGRADSKENRDLFKIYLKPHSLDSGKMAELDALEIYYPGGIAGFLDKSLSQYDCDFNPDNESWLLDPKKGLLPRAKSLDV
jgi:hypothetical protein